MLYRWGHHYVGEKREGNAISAIIIFIKSLENLKATSIYVYSIAGKNLERKVANVLSNKNTFDARLYRTIVTYLF
jgi:hypothetical protein